MHEAVPSALGPERFTEPAPDRAQFLPHVSIDYINRDGDTEPIAAALSKLTTRAVDTTFTKADLLEFHRDNQMYEWNSATPIPIGELAVSSVDRCATLVCQLICDTWSAECGMRARSGVVPEAAVAPIAARTDVLNAGAIRW
jgi:hypothetical protein